MSGDLVSPNPLMWRVESTKYPKKSYVCEIQEVHLLSMPIAPGSEFIVIYYSNNLLHHPLSWSSWTLLSDWGHFLLVVNFHFSKQKVIQPFSIFDLLDVYSYDIPYPCHTAQDYFKGPSMFLLCHLSLEVPSSCYLDFRSEIISLPVTFIWVLDGCLHGLG